MIINEYNWYGWWHNSYYPHARVLCFHLDVNSLFLYDCDFICILLNTISIGLLWQYFHWYEGAILHYYVFNKQEKQNRNNQQIRHRYGWCVLHQNQDTHIRICLLNLEVFCNNLTETLHSLVKEIIGIKNNSSLKFR